MVQEIILSIRNVAYANEEKLNPTLRKSQVYFFSGLVILGIIVFWEGYESLIVGLGTFIGTIVLSLKSARLIRFCMLLAPPCWLVYSIIVGSFSGILVAAFVEGSPLRSRASRDKGDRRRSAHSPARARCGRTPIG